MSVTAYDGQFSFRQNELATKGIDHDKKGMSAEQYEKFKESPFMKKARMQEEYTWTMTCDRDRKRKERDPAFKPQDSDFTAPKAYEYEKNVNYYKVLGIDDLASLEDVKKAYKKLSLIYHPDKTQGMSREQQDEHQAIFMELKNAYLVLGDQATRRQYDRDRDYMDAGAEVNGIKKKPDKQAFDATVVLKKLQEMQKPPGQERIVEVYCKLEKFFYGGAKVFKRNRRVIKEGYEYYADKIFRIDLPKGAAENWACKLRGGDMNWDSQPDTYKFKLRSKEHEILERQRGGFDLEVKKQVILKPDAHLQPFLNMEVNTLGGRTILFWGRNPLYSQTGAAQASLRVAVQGEALGPTGSLHFTAQVSEGRTVRQGGKAIVVLVRTAYTKVEFYVSVDIDGTVESLKRAIAEVLEWPEEKPVKVMKIIDDKETSAFYSDKVQLGNARKVQLEANPRIYEVPMSIRCARELLSSVLVHCDTEPFSEELLQCKKLRGTAAGEQRVRELWDSVTYLGPTCGYNNNLEGLRTAVNRALWVLRSEPDAQVLQERYAQFGFWPCEPPKVKIPKRRRLPRPPVEQFLIRNGLGPAKWAGSEDNWPDPGSETESEKEEDEAEKPEEVPELDLLFGRTTGPVGNASQKVRKSHGTFAAAVHPQMVKRSQRRESISPVCNLELAPMFGYGETLQLFTKPPCYLHFYSNLRQSWTVQPGHLRPRPMFAIAVCCPTGAKRVGREAWTRLRTRLIPLLKQNAFYMLAEARNILPRPLPATPVYPEEEYWTEDGIKVMRPGEDEGELEEDTADSEEEREITALAKQKAAAGGKEGEAAGKAGPKAGKPVRTKTVEKDFGDRKPRVLCLHDAAGSKEIFEVQAMHLFAACKDKVELIVLDGPEPCKAGEELDNIKEFFPGKAALQYAEPHLDGKGWRCYRNVRSALSWIQGKIEELEPIDGVVGFSQGADFAAMLAGQSFAGSGTPLSFVCLLNPTAPGYAAELTDLFTGSPLPVPAFIVRGEQEAYDDGLKKTLKGRSINTLGEKAPAAHVAKFFEAAEVKVHSEGHRPFPLDKREADEVCKALVDFIVAKSPEPPVVELEEGELEDGEIEDDEDDDGKGSTGGGGMFDFDDLTAQDEVDTAAEEIRQQRRSERRRKGAAREVWRRDARMQAKRSEHVKALLAKEEAEGVPAFPQRPESQSEEAARWKRLAGRAFQGNDFFTAQALYRREMACLKEEDTEALAIALSNRSACLLKARHFEAALADAQRATELRPTWGRGWMRVGAASSSIGGTNGQERTRSAWFKAVECDPSAQHIEGLAAAWQNFQEKKTELGHANKEKGNEALRGGDWGTAVAYFTIGITTLPPPPGKGFEDEDELLRSILHTNRCTALCRAKYWQAAVKNGELAVEFKEDYAKAYCRLGVAQLGCKMNEQAYTSFAKALHHDDKCRVARQGREVCMGLIPHWDSPKALRRCARFGKDRFRPLETTKVYVVSDVHYDFPANEEWCGSIHATKFLDDILIVSGNLADSFRALTRALTTLRAKFRRVFYVPGNHEMWIPTSEAKKFPDSLCKLWAIMELCDELDVDIFPAAVCKDVYIVPLLSWYNLHFDMNDPFPDPKSTADKYAKWPIDKDGQVWRYMLRLNQEHLCKPYHGTVITISHFLPRHNLPLWREKGVWKTSGCIEIDDQVREARATCHIYGHSGYRHNQVHDGVAYVHRPLQESVEEGQRDPIMCIFNGKNLCSDLVQIH